MVNFALRLINNNSGEALRLPLPLRLYVMNLVNVWLILSKSIDRVELDWCGFHQSADELWLIEVNFGELTKGRSISPYVMEG